MPTDDHARRTTHSLTLQEAVEAVESVESKVLGEDKMGASRNDVVEGTCQRIIHELRENAGDMEEL